MKFIFYFFSIFVLIALLTGGIAFIDEEYHCGNDRKKIGDLECHLFVGEKYQEFHLPLIVHYYRLGGPFFLKVQFFDKKNQFELIEIDEVIVDFPDKSSQIYYIKFKEYFIKHLDYFICEGSLGVSIPAFSNISIKIKGKTIKNNNITGFEKTFNINYFPKKRFFVLPYWYIVFLENNFKT